MLPTPPPPKAPEPCPPDPVCATAGNRTSRPRVSRCGFACVTAKVAEQFSPAPFDECACTGTPQKPNSICESYCLELTTTEPACLKEIEKHKDCGCDDCLDFYNGLLEPVRRITCDCLPLAGHSQLHARQGRDRKDDRQLDAFAPSSPASIGWTRSSAACSTRCHGASLTHICDMNWTHGSELRCHEFLNRFIGQRQGVRHQVRPARAEPKGIRPPYISGHGRHHPGSARSGSANGDRSRRCGSR